MGSWPPGEIVMQTTKPVVSKKLVVLAGLSILIATLVQVIHHWYGAIYLNTPWRMQMVYWSPLGIAFVFALLYTYYKWADNRAGKIAFWVFIH